MIIKTAKELRPRAEYDNYPTPFWLARAALDLAPDFDYQVFVDAGAGGGVWGRAARMRWPRACITGVEIREIDPRPEEYNYWKQMDFLNYYEAAHMVFGNPPYSQAEDFIWHAKEMLYNHGYIVFLLRLAFLEGQERGRGLWARFPPKLVAVCSRRPSYTGDGKTDATAYAVYVWQKCWRGKTRLVWLREREGEVEV